MALDDDVISDIAQHTGYDKLVVQQVLQALNNHPYYTVRRLPSAPPRKRRCKQCKGMKPSDELNELGNCERCAKAPPPDDRQSSGSIRTASGGLPSLGKRKP